MNPLNIGLVDLSTYIFDCGWHKQGHNKLVKNDVAEFKLGCFLSFFNPIWIFNALNAGVMRMNPLNYDLVGVSTDIFDCGWATQGLKYPIKHDVAKFYATFFLF